MDKLFSFSTVLDVSLQGGAEVRIGRYLYVEARTVDLARAALPEVALEVCQQAGRQWFAAAPLAVAVVEANYIRPRQAHV